MQFIEVTIGTGEDDKQLINPNNIVSCKRNGSGSAIETDLTVFNAFESYQQVRLMIGRSCGGITTAADVRISEVE